MAGATTGADVFAPDTTGGVSADFFNGYFGDGSDGDSTVVVSFTAPREMHYNNLTIPAGTVFKPNGYRIFVAGTLTIEAGASFNDDGLSSTSNAGATGLGSRNYLGGFGGQGGNGFALTAVNFGNGTAGTAATNTSLNNLGQAPTGGKGGDVTLRANVGGSGGAATQPSPQQKWNGRAFVDGRFTAGVFGCSSGGGGGAINVTAYTSGTFQAGGGGAGGGIVWIAAKNIANSGRISANGGNGFNGVLAVGSAECAGGGGGGGGCVAIITTTPFASLGTVQVNGGIGGTGVFNVGTGVIAGTNGNQGSLFTLIVK
jgi:hypothetical protein